MSVQNILPYGRLSAFLRDSVLEEVLSYGYPGYCFDHRILDEIGLES